MFLLCPGTLTGKRSEHYQAMKHLSDECGIQSRLTDQGSWTINPHNSQDSRNDAGMPLDEKKAVELAASNVDVQGGSIIQPRLERR